ncbi:MAG: TROVE domain-containing protein [Aureispira sp.]|nr:TROVE domain-containing protein [Aureispira sp.]
MAKFNLLKRKKRETTNYMGAKAYKYDAKFELVSLLLTSFAEDSYYRSSGEGIKAMLALLAKVDPMFAAKAAIFARDEFNMRSITHVLAAELAAYLSGKEWAKEFYNCIVVRPDDMLEIVAYYYAKGGKTLPNAMKKGFAKAFERFDAYQLAKYRRAKGDVKLVDLANLVHPKPVQRNKEALKALIEDTLRNEKTWEAQLTKAGKADGDKATKETAKREAWEGLILSGKMGYMALLRNLRNLITSGISEAAMDKALGYLTNPTAVSRSRQFPFRFLSAYAEIEKLKGASTTKGTLVFEKDTVDSKLVKRVLNAIETAINLSIANLPLLSGETVILTDNSGSMRGDGGGSSALSAMSKVKTADIANLFATMYWSRCDNTVVGLFGDRLAMPKLDRKKGLFDNFKKVNAEGGKVGLGTEAGIFTMFEKLIKERRMVDRIVIFSDMQIGTGCSWYDTKGRRGDDFNKLWEKYRKINPNVRVYSIYLRGCGTTVFKGNVYKLAGWSEKIFSLMELLEQDRNAMITAINDIKL